MKLTQEQEHGLMEIVNKHVSEPRRVLKSIGPYIVFDIDGTLANIKHRLHNIQDGNKNWEKFNSECHKDEPNKHIIEINKLMCDRNNPKHYPAIIVTGREETYAAETREWLQNHGITWTYLFMRPTKDYRSDVEIKREIIEKYIQPAEILFVLDDREKVVDLWRSMGYKCLQVQKGDY